jgi:hypothetical protein
MDITEFVTAIQDAAQSRQDPLERSLLEAQIQRLLEQFHFYVSFVNGPSIPSIFETARRDGIILEDLPSIFQGQARHVFTSHPTSVVHIEAFKVFDGIQSLLLESLTQENSSITQDQIDSVLQGVREGALVRHDKRTPETEAKFAALVIKNCTSFSKIVVERVWSSAKEFYPDMEPQFFVKNIVPFFVPAINSWSGGGDRDGSDAVTAQSLRESLPIFQENTAQIAGSPFENKDIPVLAGFKESIQSQNFLQALDRLYAALPSLSGDNIVSGIVSHSSLQSMTVQGPLELRQNTTVFWENPETSEQLRDTQEWLSVALESGVRSLVLADCEGIDDMKKGQSVLDDVSAQSEGSSPIAVIPLFERVAHLLKAPDTMKEWAISQAENWARQGRTGVIKVVYMCAYSDSTKNAGYPAATLAFQEAVLGMEEKQKEVNDIFRDNGYPFTVVFAPLLGSGSSDPGRGGGKPTKSLCRGAGIEWSVTKTAQGGDALQLPVLMVQGLEEQLRLAQDRIRPNNIERQQIQKEFSKAALGWIQKLSDNYSANVYSEHKTDSDTPNRFLATLNTKFEPLVKLLNVSSRKSNKKPEENKTLQGCRAIGLSNLQAIMGGTFTALGDGEALWDNVTMLYRDLRRSEENSLLKYMALESPTPESFANVLYSKVPQIRPMIDPMAQIAIFFDPNHFWQQATGDNDLPDKKTLKALAASSQDPMKKDAAKTVLEIEKTSNILLQFLSGQKSNLPLDEAQESLLSWMPYYREKRDAYHEALRDIAPIMSQFTEGSISLNPDLEKEWRTRCANLQFSFHNMELSGSTETSHGSFVKESPLENRPFFLQRLAAMRQAAEIFKNARIAAAPPTANGALWDLLSDLNAKNRA